MSFATTLNFTSSNEDGRTELEALALRPGNRVLCLTASGTRALDLLLAGPSRITALDLNPAQNRLLALKIAAIRALSYDDLMAYLGLAPCTDRRRLHERVAELLAPADVAYWKARLQMIARGVWHQGRWERVLALGAHGTRLIRGRNVDRLFAAGDVEAQAELWRARFDDRIWRGAIRLLSRRWIWTRVVGEPGGSFLPSPADVEARLAGAFTRAARTHLFRDSEFATLVFRGRHTAGGALPLHMSAENVEIIRPRLERIDIQTGDLASLRPEVSGAFDAFSLSDFGSYCNPATYAASWAGVLRVASPGARFCERMFMNPLPAPPSLAEQIHIDAGRSAGLTRADRAIIYEIRAGTLDGAASA